MRRLAEGKQLGSNLLSCDFNDLWWTYLGASRFSAGDEGGAFGRRGRGERTVEGGERRIEPKRQFQVRGIVGRDAVLARQRENEFAFRAAVDADGETPEVGEESRRPGGIDAPPGSCRLPFGWLVLQKEK